MQKCSLRSMLELQFDWRRALYDQFLICTGSHLWNFKSRNFLKIFDFCESSIWVYVWCRGASGIIVVYHRSLWDLENARSCAGVEIEMWHPEKWKIAFKTKAWSFRSIWSGMKLMPASFWLYLDACLLRRYWSQIHFPWNFFTEGVVR